MLAADFKGLQTPSDSEVDQMVRWINACSGCPHKNTRKDNMLRHVNTVHKGFAQISQYPANKLPVGVGDTGPSNMFFSNDVTLGFSTLRKQTKAKDPSTFFMGGIADVIKGVAEFQDNIRKIVAGDMNPAFRYQFGQVSTLPVTASKNATLVGAAASNPRIFLGFRAFICEKCHNIELFPSYLHSDPKIREGVSTHLCPNKVIPNNNQNSEIVRKLYDDVLTFMAWKFKEWAQEKVYVYAIPANEEPVTEQLNFVNFGKVSKNSFVYLAAKYGNSEILDPISLWGFVREAKATYCLCEFTHRGMKQRYFLYLYRVPKRSP